jgi:transposase
MVTVPEECITEEQSSVVRFLWPKRFNAEDIHKKCFLFTVGSVCCVKTVQNWVEKFSQGRSKVADDARSGRPVETATEAKTSMLRVSTHW